MARELAEQKEAASTDSLWRRGPRDAVEDVRGARRGHPRKKRANHNELERRRRNYQKGTMADLREAIPILTNDKPSTVLTLTKGAAVGPSEATCSPLQSR